MRKSRDEELKAILKEVADKFNKDIQTVMTIYQTPHNYGSLHITAKEYEWKSNDIKVTEINMLMDWKDHMKALKYDYFEVVNCFLYFIDLRDIYQITTESTKEFVDIQLYYPDGNSIDKVIKRLKKGIEEFSNFTGFEVVNIGVFAETNESVRTKVSRKKRFDRNVSAVYQIIVKSVFEGEDEMRCLKEELGLE